MTKREAKRHALGFAESAIDGALNHSASDHDPVMMRWAKGDHEKVMGEVAAIRDALRIRLRGQS
jgi:hypothetical protein